MDKQIIVDNVDVSGCPNFTFNKIEPNESICISEQSAMCINNKDCLYKKWQRKEQECETLASQLDFEVQKKECLELECEELIEKLKEMNEVIRTETTRCSLVNSLKAELDQLKAEQNIIKTLCENHFDEYEIGCLDLSDAIESLLERYDNAITGLTKQRKELKAENEKLKQYKEVVDKLAGMQIILTNEEKMPMLYENAKDLKLKQLSQTLTEIKEIANSIVNGHHFTTDIEGHLKELTKQILQKISEVTNE